MAQRPELAPYIGKWIQITAEVRSRADGGEYGFLLTSIQIESGATIDHCWLKVYDNDLAAVSGSTIRGQALIDKYWKATRIDGRYVEAGESGTGISGLAEVEVEVDGVWMPLDAAATLHRKARAAKVKAAKADGSYIWPGAWTMHGGDWLVKAAKSAVAGSLCDVRAARIEHSRYVTLVTQVSAGVWSWTEPDKLPA
jgi:hypothetical protein